MNTAANVHRSESSHWYFKDGSPAYQLPKKSGKGIKKVTLAEARELSLLPSVTTILRVLDKPNLNRWLTEQSVNAVLTTPRNKDEALDDFVKRVLHDEKVQDEEAQIARDKGTAVHDAIESCLNGRAFDPAWRPYVEAVLPVVASLGKIVWTEKVLVGDGYAGRSDILLETDRNLTLLDFKTASRLPKESYPEHKMQTAAYAKTIGNVSDRHILTGNLYISTVMPGATSLSLQEDWSYNYEEGFVSAMRLWQYINSYKP